MSGARVLVVDDDPAIVRAVRRALEGHGYSVRTGHTGVEAVELARTFRPEIVLLDLVLPDMDGIAVTREIRAGSEAAILVLSAIGDDRKKVEALDEGADDYITKPFSMDELLARVRVALRRSAGRAAAPVLEAGGVRLDLGSHNATVEGEPVHLTPKEFDLCRLLLEYEGRILTQRYLLAQVWGAEYADDAHILRTFVHQLRGKLGPAGSAILTDPGVGYRFVAKS